MDSGGLFRASPSLGGVFLYFYRLRLMDVEISDISGPTELDNTNRNFKGQMKTEEVVCFCRKHWIVILLHIGVFLLVCVLFFLFLALADKGIFTDILGKSGYRIMAFVTMAVLTYFFHRFFLKLFNYYLQILIVTNYRIVELDKTVFLKDSRDAIDLPEIQDITMKQNGIFQTIFDYGELCIILSSVGQPIKLRFIPNPDYHFRKINSTKREYILKRQFLKQGFMERVSEGLQDTKTQNLPQSISPQIKDI